MAEDVVNLEVFANRKTAFSSPRVRKIVGLDYRK